MALHDKERAMSCPVCGYVSYPRIMPAVIVGVKNGDQLLLTKYRTGFAYNALIAGFTEIGETVEETVMREVMEMCIRDRMVWMHELLNKTVSGVE